MLHHRCLLVVVESLHYNVLIFVTIELETIRTKHLRVRSIRRQIQRMLTFYLLLICTSYTLGPDPPPPEKIDETKKRKQVVNNVANGVSGELFVEVSL